MAANRYLRFDVRRPPGWAAASAACPRLEGPLSNKSCPQVEPVPAGDPWTGKGQMPRQFGNG